MYRTVHAFCGINNCVCYRCRQWNLVRSSIMLRNLALGDADRQAIATNSVHTYVCRPTLRSPYSFLSSAMWSLTFLSFLFILFATSSALPTLLSLFSLDGCEWNHLTAEKGLRIPCGWFSVPSSASVGGLARVPRGLE